VLGILALAGCGAPPRLTVAAASNLTGTFDEIGRAFTAETGIEVVFSYGSTAALAQQVEAGAPVDVFAAADTEHVAHLVLVRKVVHHAVYARGQLALWSPGASIKTFKDLTRPDVKFVAIAQPELAPYGEAAVQALRASGVWEEVQPKLVYAGSVSQAKQLAATGNADAAFTAYSLVFREPGSVVRVDGQLYAPIDQALGVVSASPRAEDARKFAAFVLGPKGRAILIQDGYLVQSNP
jgi:molybdate transport system substrate-binding protein